MMEQMTSISTNQLIRFRDSTVGIQTEIFHGVECLCMEDVQRRFPSVTALSINNIQLAFLRDDNGSYSNPLRIRARSENIIEALEPEGKSDDTIHARFDRLDAKIQEMDKKTDLIVQNTQEVLIRLKHVMTQMYELHEYTTPRYFFILPSRHHDWKVINGVQNLFHLRYKLYFLCECSDEPDKLHIAPHDGYSVKAPSEFIANYGSYLRTTLNIARGILSVGGFLIDHTGSVSTLGIAALPPMVQERANYEEMDNKLNVVEEMLNQTNGELVRVDPSMTRKATLPETPLQGAQLRELEAFLDLVDHSRSLGNLYRTVTDDGHVRWVCLEHYNSIGFNNKVSEHIRQLEAIGGKFDQETKQVILTGNLTNKNIAMICEALTKGFTMFTLVLQNCSLDTNDLAQLFDTIINRSAIHRVVLSNVEAYKWMGMSKSVCEDVKISFKNQSLTVHFASRCPKDDARFVIRLFRRNKICRTFHFFGYDLLDPNADLLRFLKDIPDLTSLVIHHFMNIDFLNEIITSNTSLRRLKLTYWFNSSSIFFGLCQTIGQNRTLVDLDILDHTSVDNKAATSELLQSIRKHPSIKHLRLHVFNVKPWNEHETPLIDVLSNDTFITHLRISDSVISHPLIQAIIHACEVLRSLIHLEFYRCQLNEEDTSQLQTLYTKESLTHLTISEHSYWSIALAEMREQMKNEFPQYQNMKLKEKIVQSYSHSSVCLDEMKLLDQDMEIVVQEAIINKQCHFLSLRSNKITSMGASILAEALTNNHNLETLYLENNYISDDGAESLANVLTSHNNTVKTLVLQRNKITDRGAGYLARMLEVNQTLTWLYLGENELNNDGVRLLSQALETSNKTLELLVLSSNKLLTDLSLDYLLPMIETNQSLRKLWIDDCSLSNNGKEKLENTQQLKKDFYVRT